MSIFAGALFIQMSMGWNMYLSIAVLLTITGVFTILGMYGKPLEHVNDCFRGFHDGKCTSVASFKEKSEVRAV